MKRRLLNVLTLLSLLLWVATVALWVRSGFATEWLVYQKTEPSDRLWWKIAFVSTPGRLYISYARVDFKGDGLAEEYQEATRNPEGFWNLRQPPESTWGRFPEGFKPTGADKILDRLGFQFLSDVRCSPVSTMRWPRMYVPYWFLTTATAVLPVMWWRRRRRQRIRSRGRRCVSCGYDLRATPGRCPECGEAVASTPAK